MSTLAPLAMSQKKEDLLRHLNMSPETYALMAKETDLVYKELTSNKRHLKKNCKRKAPYDWSDIVEKSKDEAMATIARSAQSEHTAYYWDLAGPSTDDCPNWIARWFLYHKFRYRDGRNRTVCSEGCTHAHSAGGAKYHHHRHHDKRDGETKGYDSYYNTQVSNSSGQTMISSTNDLESNNYPPINSTVPYTGYIYDSNVTYSVTTTPYADDSAEADTPKLYYDPVRDAQRDG
ncbi:hypothetical protein B7494_g7221 [Chlorociboria aeruginascens]|nr:hypothetical protein B7494_g7221 [Chlorociboria aeruginascens]